MHGLAWLSGSILLNEIRIAFFTSLTKRISLAVIVCVLYFSLRRDAYLISAVPSDPVKRHLAVILKGFRRCPRIFFASDSMQRCPMPAVGYGRQLLSKQAFGTSWDVIRKSIAKISGSRGVKSED